MCEAALPVKLKESSVFMMWLVLDSTAYETLGVNFIHAMADQKADHLRELVLVSVFKDMELSTWAEWLRWLWVADWSRGG